MNMMRRGLGVSMQRELTARTNSQAHVSPPSAGHSGPTISRDTHGPSCSARTQWSVDSAEDAYSRCGRGDEPAAKLCRRLRSVAWSPLQLSLGQRRSSWATTTVCSLRAPRRPRLVCAQLLPRVHTCVPSLQQRTQSLTLTETAAADSATDFGLCAVSLAGTEPGRPDHGGSCSNTR